MDGKENEKMRATNLTLLTDLYELTMMQGYFKNPTDQIVVFDAFYRKNPCDGGYAISCGLSDVIDYIKNLHFSYDDIQYLKSLNIFDEDFLDYLAGFHFTGHRADRAGTAHRDSSPQHAESPVPDRYESGPRMLRG